MSDWTAVGDGQPPRGEVVEVLTRGGDHRALIFDSGLWWLPDRSMYVYFTPTHWRRRVLRSEVTA